MAQEPKDAFCSLGKGAEVNTVIKLPGLSREQLVLKGFQKVFPGYLKRGISCGSRREDLRSPLVASAVSTSEVLHPKATILSGFNLA